MTSIILVIIGLAAAYGISLRLSPTWPCGRCQGKGARQDFLRPKAAGRCRHCGGTGRKPRLGVRLLMPGTYKQMNSGNHGRHY
jgi:DnaJ-class molecular chaperone